MTGCFTGCGACHHCQFITTTTMRTKILGTNPLMPSKSHASLAMRIGTTINSPIKIGMKIIMRAALIVLALAPVTGKAQQLFYPWAAVTTTATPGTITAGNTFQTALASNANRKGCILINTSSHTLYVYFGALANALTTTSVPVGAGNTFPCNVGPVVMTDGVQVTTSTTNDTFVVLSMQ